MKHFFGNSNYEKYYKDLVPYIKKEKNQKYIAIILSLSASIFFLLFAVSPTVSTIVNLRKQISDATFVQQKLSEKINNISTLSQQYIQIQNDISYVVDAVPQNPQIPTLVGQIQAIGQQSSVSLSNVQVSPVALTSGGSANSSSFTFEITGNSSFANIQSFLSNLTSMQRAMSVIAIQISKNSNETDSLDFTIRGKAYFKK